MLHNPFCQEGEREAQSSTCTPAAGQHADAAGQPTTNNFVSRFYTNSRCFCAEGFVFGLIDASYIKDGVYLTIYVWYAS
jgi:hypothetical protein